MPKQVPKHPNPEQIDDDNPEWTDADFARAEGEDDLTLESWRAGHKRFFTRTRAPIGKEFTEDMPLVCERFRVIYK